MLTRALILTTAVVACLATAACNPATTSPTQQNTAANAVPAQTAGGPSAGGAAAPAPAGDDKLKDVSITKCEADPTLHWPSAEVTITNHTSKASNYMVQVEFLNAAGTRVGEGLAATNGLAPGQVSIQKAQGAAEISGKLSCRVIDVTRYAAA